MTLRLLTYNIRLGKQHGLAAIADEVAPQRPDIVALQEVGRDWTMGPEGDTTAALARLLDLPHRVFVPSIAQGHAHYGHALLSRYPVTACRFDTLPRRDDEPRTLLRTILATSDGPIRVVSTHLSYIDDRALQTSHVLEALRDSDPTPTVLMGDLNTAAREPSEGDLEFLAALAELTVDADPDATPTYPADAPRVRLDYICARDGRLTDTTIGASTTASDHRFVAATWTSVFRRTNPNML